MTELKKEFNSGNNEMKKVVELKKVKQKSRMMKKFVQKSRRTVKGSGYKGRSLIEEFKREMNDVIMQKLMELE